MKESEIIDFLTGNADADQKPMILDWINSSDENREEFYRLKNLMALTGKTAEEDQKTEKDLSLLFGKISKQQRTVRMRMLTTVLKYAAVVFVTLFVFRFIVPSSIKMPTDNKWLEVTTQSGQTAQISLPDGTKVWLNSRTNIKYPTSFSAKNREVTISGEAFFNVTHDANSPFLVHTQNYSIKVLGTSFNVSAYKGDKLSETTLIEGKVTLLDNKNRELKKLEPGQLFLYNSINNSFNISNVNTEYYTSWKEGYYSFEKEKLENIASKLERIYSVRINIADAKTKNLSFTGTILKNKPLEQILRIIELTAPVEISVSHHSSAEDVITINPKNKK